MRRFATAIAIGLLAMVSPATDARADEGCETPEMTWVASRIPLPDADVDTQREGWGVADTLAAIPAPLRPCLTAALVVLAATGDAASDLDLDALARRATEGRCTFAAGDERAEKRRAIALAALGAIEPSWGVAGTEALPPDSITADHPDQRAAEAAIYALLPCIDARLASRDDAKKRADARAVRGLVELAHANAHGNFFAILFAEPVSCGPVREKIEAAKAQRAYSASEFATKAVFVEASARVLAASLDDCGQAPAMIDAAIEAIADAFAQNLFARSVEGWRWVNDLLYLEAVLRLARGDRERAPAAVARLEGADVLPAGDRPTNAGPVSSGTGAYVDNVHPEARKALRDLERARDAPYLDQVFVRRPVPGWTSGAPARSDPFMSNKDAAMALREIIDAERPACGTQCPEALKELDSQLRGVLVRRDVRIVAGSYSDEGAAVRGAESLCRRLGEEAVTCPFTEDRSGRYHRVATAPMSDADVRKLAQRLASQKIDYFLSRPQVIAPL